MDGEAGLVEKHCVAPQVEIIMGLKVVGRSRGKAISSTAVVKSLRVLCCDRRHAFDALSMFRVVLIVLLGAQWRACLFFENTESPPFPHT